MHFDFVDAVLEIDRERIVTIKQVTRSEEYLQDHFPDFPVLPGVFMVESLVQAARRLAGHLDPSGGASRLVLGQVRALKYGSFVRPGQTLRLEVSLLKSLPDGSMEFKGEGTVHAAGTMSADAPVAVSGRLTLRPVRLG